MQIRTHAAAKNTGRIQAARGVPRFEQRSVHAGSAISATRYDIEQPVRIDFVVKADGPARRVALVAHGPDTIDGICSGYITRSEEHTSELQSLMRISYAVFCLKK